MLDIKFKKCCHTCALRDSYIREEEKRNYVNACALRDSYIREEEIHNYVNACALRDSYIREEEIRQGLDAIEVVTIIGCEHEKTCKWYDKDEEE